LFKLDNISVSQIVHLPLKYYIPFILERSLSSMHEKSPRFGKGYEMS
jgi:hypothetical protein